MANAVAWFMLFLGIVHIVIRLLRFKGPVRVAVGYRWIALA
jgi:hypothetical protein